MTKWAQIFTGLLFYAYVGIHQVRILVFDNYRKHTLPLTINPDVIITSIYSYRPYITIGLGEALQYFSATAMNMRVHTVCMIIHASHTSSLKLSALCTQVWSCTSSTLRLMSWWSRPNAWLKQRHSGDALCIFALGTWFDKLAFHSDHSLLSTHDKNTQRRISWSILTGLLLPWQQASQQLFN